jgi:hybrid cluster-associated redox disulfide protein
MEQSTNAIPDQTWTVAQVLSAYPQAAQVFFHLKTDCVGCILSRFCTLKEVAKSYNLDLDQVVLLFSQTANASQPKE